MEKKLSIISISVLVCFQLNAQQLLTLDSCRKMAIENNKELKIRNEQIKAATNMKKVAFTQYLPNISASGGYMHNSENLSLLSEDKFAPVGKIMPDGSFGFDASQVNNNWTIINGQPVPLDATGKPFNPKQDPEKIQWKGYAYLPKEEFTVDINNVFTGGISLVQPLFMGGKIRELNRMANYAKIAAEAQKDATLSEILYSVDEAYWQVVSIQNKLLLTQEYKKLVEKLFVDVTASAEEGFATKSDILKVKVKANEADLNVIKAKNGLNLSEMFLCQLIGIEVGSEIKLADENISIEDVILPQVSSIEDVYKKRPEIQMLQQAANVAKSNVNLKYSEFLPTIALTAMYSTMNPTPYNGFLQEFQGAWMVGIVANVPIFHFGERIYKMNAAKAERNISEYNLEAAKEKIELQVRQSDYKIHEAAKRLTMTNENLQSAQENLRFAEEGYKEGVINLTDFISAQMAWQSAHNEQIDAAINYLLCNTYLLKATGNLK